MPSRRSAEHPEWPGFTLADISDPADHCAVTGSGLYGEYYRGKGFREKAADTNTDATVNFNWGSGRPDPSVPAEHFSVRWSRLASGTRQRHIQLFRQRR
jgi:hypothetical protein